MCYYLVFHFKNSVYTWPMIFVFCLAGKFEIDPAEITIGDQLGAGCFGVSKVKGWCSIDIRADGFVFTAFFG